MWHLLYNYKFLPLLWIAVHIVALFKDKVRRGIEGRQNIFERLTNSIEKLDSISPRIWIHSSSMGEFEQAKPIILALKKVFPKHKIIVTLFSPSAYEHSLHYPNADVIEYLPFDTEGNAKKFFSIVNPEFGIIIRYDVWPNFVWEAKKLNIPLFIVNATIRSSSVRLWKIFYPFQQLVYNSFSKIMTVSGEDKISFELYNLTSEIITVGDTRFDQVIKRAEDAKLKDVLPEKVTTGKQIFIIAQSWREDEKITLPPLIRLLQERENLLLLIVPHEPTSIKLEEMEDKLNWLSNISHCRLSEILSYNNEKIIIVDGVGILTTLYKYVFAAYVGGSFRQGVHNVLEPAVFGLPLFYGPRHTNSQEAVSLSKIGAAKIINSTDELYYQLTLLLNDESIIKEIGKLSSDYVKENAGATIKVIENIKSVLNKK